MRVVVKVYRPAELQYLRWYASLGTTDRERRDRLAIYIAAMTDRLRLFDGIPPEAVPDRRYRAVWWWQFTDAVAVQFTIRDDPPPPRGWWDVGRKLARLIRRPVRTVLVTRVTDRPPPEVVGSAPRR